MLGECRCCFESFCDATVGSPCSRMRVRANSGAGDGWLGMLLRVWLLSGQCVRECAGAGWTDKGLLAIENCTRGEYQPGALSYASSRNRSAQHRAGTLFGLQSKVDTLHVPYRGGGSVRTDVIGGLRPVCFTNIASRRLVPCRERSGRNRAKKISG